MSAWLSSLTTSNFLKPTYINGFLDVSGGDTINRNGNLILYGGDASFNKRLFVNGDSSLNGNLFVGNNLTIYGNLTVQQATNNTIFNTLTTNVFSLSEDISLNGRIFVNSVGSNAAAISIANNSSNSSNKVIFYSNLAASQNNGIVAVNDNGFIFGTTANGATSGFVIAPNVSSGSSGLKVSSSGNVGIGTTSPGCALSFGNNTYNKILAL